MYLQVDGSNLRIAGTMHVFPAESPDVPGWLWQAYDWAEELVIECDSSTFAPHRLLTDGSELSDHVSPEAVSELRSRWSASLGPLDELKPWAAFLSAPHAIVPNSPGVEAQLTARAATDKKPVYWLESGEDLARTFDALPTVLISERLEFIIRNPDIVRSAIRGVHTAWLSCSIPALLALASQLPMFAIPALRDRLLLDRNRAWMPHFRVGIEASSRTLFLVGALHLCGQGNVTELIEQEGHGLSTLECPPLPAPGFPPPRSGRASRAGR